MNRVPTYKPLLTLLILAVGAASAMVLTVTQASTAQETGADKKLSIVAQADRQDNPGPLSPVQKRAINQGYLVPDQAAYERQKAEAGTGQRPSERAAVPSAKAPATFRTWQGIHDTSAGPSDSTGAVGPTRYVELVNSRFAIYNRTSNVPLGTGTLHQLAGAPATDSVFDPQIMWDPTTSRFYYTMDDVVSATQNFLAFGFSKTASPNSAADWCQYVINYGAEFPDYPKLGDSGNLALIGVNTFDGVTGAFRGSDLVSITKPPAGTTCPDPATLTVDAELNLRNANGSISFTPVPANQTDTNTAGYVVARPGSLPAGFLSLYRVTRNADGTMTVGAARNVSVPGYTVPPNAPQPGTTNRLDTLDTRNTQAVSAVDPLRRGVTGLWTQHTVRGGAGAVVRWYEINVNTATLLQSGTVSGSSGRYIYNGAVSPDRKRLGTTAKFGSSMVLGFNSSSSTQRPDIRTVSKIGSNPVSGQVLIRSSPTVLRDFTCVSGTCRWGDYAAATPDPLTSTAANRGNVWLTSNFVRASGSSFATGWGTWNWAAKP